MRKIVNRIRDAFGSMTLLEIMVLVTIIVSMVLGGRSYEGWVY